MNYFIIEYFLFITKILTILMLIILIMVIFISFKKYKIENQLKIKNINKEYYLEKKNFYENIFEKKIAIKKNKILKDQYINLKKNNKNNLFIINFNDDLNAIDTTKIKKIISILILTIEKNDEILIKLNSSGGFVNNYGLAALQFLRLKKYKIKITVAIDLIAASGGYLIASIGDKIIASEFAIIGSIGVISTLPNFDKLLKKCNIEIENHTSGEYKSSINIFAGNNTKIREKFLNTLKKTHILFKYFVKINRKNLNIEKISSGDYWYGYDALKLNLIDKIQTSDEYILEKIIDTKIYEIDIEKKYNLWQN